MDMVTLTTSIMFLLFTFGCGEFYECGSRVRRPPIRWSAIAESLRKTDVGSHLLGLVLSLFDYKMCIQNRSLHLFQFRLSSCLF
jgi:hypothetical protein